MWKSAKGSRLHYASGSGVGKSTVITATLGTVVAHCSDDHIKELKQDFFFCLLSRLSFQSTLLVMGMAERDKKFSMSFA